MLFDTQIIKESVLDECDYPEYGIKFIESSGWHGSGKYQYCDYIFKHNDKFYAIDDRRTGSYHTEWNYGSEHWQGQIDCVEVEKREKITYEWARVKNNG